VEAIHPGGVAVTGHSLYEKAAAGDPVVTIRVSIPPTTNDSDLKNAAEALLNVNNIVGIFCSNEGAVGGLLNATTDGSDLAEGGRYDGLIVVGFDAGIAQKNAVRQGWFIGSVTQDPFQIGYQAVNLAVRAVQGEAVSDVDTGAKWYDMANIDYPDIAALVYD
jgi:ribose transport system substrate-binding protein